MTNPMSFRINRLSPRKDVLKWKLSEMLRDGGVTLTALQAFGEK